MKRNYTLIELLTVIGIIAILAGLIMPVIGLGIGRAKRTKCASNLKQIGSMVMLFSSDRDGSLPLYCKETGNPYTVLKKTILKATRNTNGEYDKKENGDDEKIDATSLSAESKLLWMTGLLRYARYDMSLFYCPGDENRRIELFTKDAKSSYSLNYGDSNRPGGADGATGYTKISSATRSPGAVVLLGETCEGKLGMNTLDSTVLDTFKVPAAHKPHRGYLHFVYLDGHVDPVSDRDVSTLADRSTTDHPNSIFKMRAIKDE